MHEYSLASELVTALVAEAEARGLSSISGITVRKGALFILSIPAFTEAFGIVSMGTPLEGAVLRLEEENPRLECPACGYNGEGETELGRFALCPECGSLARASGDRDLAVTSIECDEVSGGG